MTRMRVLKFIAVGCPGWSRWDGSDFVWKILLIATTCVDAHQQAERHGCHSSDKSVTTERQRSYVARVSNVGRASTMKSAFKIVGLALVLVSFGLVVRAQSEHSNDAVHRVAAELR